MSVSHAREMLTRANSLLLQYWVVASVSVTAFYERSPKHGPDYFREKKELPGK